MMEFNSFRPLSGSYISQSEEKVDEIFDIMVSVPYRGATFLNIIMTTRKRKLKLVSVPYRGATFLNLLQAFLDRIYEAGVSVPYRGATFLNFFTEERIDAICDSFRPLSGSYISQ